MLREPEAPTTSVAGGFGVLSSRPEPPPRRRRRRSSGCSLRCRSLGWMAQAVDAGGTARFGTVACGFCGDPSVWPMALALLMAELWAVGSATEGSSFVVPTWSSSMSFLGSSSVVVPGGRSKAELALSLAGRALDPTAGRPDPELAGELLAKATVAALSALGCTAGEKGLRQTLSEVDESVLSTAGGRDKALAAASAMERAQSGAAGASDLMAAEVFVARLVGSVGGRVRRPVRRWALGLAIAVLVAAAGLTAFVVHAPRAGHFRASSAYAGYSKSGQLGTSGPYDTFFHTKEQESPWVEIDLGGDRSISEVRVLNRFDCCTDRAVPLVVEVRSEQGSFHEVARREADFDDWRATFTEEKARYVKLTVPRKTLLHLRSVEVR